LHFAPPKGGRERDVPLPQSVALALSAHIARTPPVPVTLPDQRGKPVTAALLFTDNGRAWRRDVFNSRVWRPAGPPGGVHALRHFAASAWLAGGASIRDVAAYLGHADPGFTLRTYVHLMPDAADRMRAATDAALGAEARRVAAAHNRRA
jgi:integrase